MFLSEIHPKVRKELHRREFILKRTPGDIKNAKIKQTEALDPKNENRDLLAESFTKSPWIRVFSPINSTGIIDPKWRQALFNQRKKNPFFGQSNRYFEPNGNKELIEKWKAFEKDKYMKNPLGGYNTVLLQSGLMGRKNINDPEKFGAKDPNENKMFVGFKEVYGRGRPTDDPLASKSELKQRYVGGALPIPGVKSVSVGYKGGVNALREATIEWVCWSPEDLELLTPHFLEMGHAVVLEWGWGGLGGANKPIPLDYEKILKSVMDRKDKPTLHDEIRDTVFKNGGNYDAMIGVISNFEWTLRSDGGFDCTTKIVSRSISILNLVIGGGGPSSSTSSNAGLEEKIEAAGIDVGALKEWGYKWDDEGNLTDIPEFADWIRGYDINIFDPKYLKVVKEGEIKMGTKYGSPEQGYGGPMAVGDIYLDIDQSGLQNWILPKSKGFRKKGELTFDNFISEVRDQIKEIGTNMSIKSDSLDEAIESLGDNTDNIDGFIAYMKKNEGWKEELITEGVIYPAGWGALDITEVGPWVSWGWIEDNVLSRFLGKLDSENNLVQEFRSVDAIYDGDVFLGYEPTKISNHKQLITADPNICIIPGQWPLSASKMAQDLISKAGGGGGAINRAMVFTSRLIGDNKIYPMAPAPFRAYKWSDEIIGGKPTHPSKSKTANGYHNSAIHATPIYEAGYMRHLLIHLDIFEEAFTNAGTIEAACQYLFNKLNSTTGIWDLQLSTEDGDRIKVVDKNYTDNKMWELLNDAAESKCENPLNENSKVTGKLFTFPTWKKDSMVKSQTLTAKFPDSAAVTAIYGGLAVPGADAPLGGGNSADFLAASTIFSSIDGVQEGITSAWERTEANKNGTFGTKFPYNLDYDGKWSSFGVGHGFDFDPSQKKNKKTGEAKVINESINGDVFLRNELVENYAMIIGDTGEYTDFSNVLQASKGNYVATMEKYTRLKITDIEEYQSNIEDYQSGVKKMNPDDIEVSKTYAGKGDPYDELYNLDGTLKNESPFKYLDAMKYIIGISRSTSVFAIGGSSPLLDMELNIEIQGIGGITSGNVFSVDMLPYQYLDNVLFQATEINHEISDAGWNTELKGQMRVNIKHPKGAVQKQGIRQKLEQPKVDFETDKSHHPFSGGDQEQRSIKNANRARNPDGSTGRSVRAGTYDTGTQVLEE